MNAEFHTTRTELANEFAEAGRELLACMGTDAALAAIPNTDQYVVAGTLQMIAKVLPAVPPVSAAEQPSVDTPEFQKLMAQYGFAGRVADHDHCPESVAEMHGKYRELITHIDAHLARQSPAPDTEEPGPWKVLAEDDKPDASRLIDVVLTGGWTLHRQNYSRVDWTQVADWRYSAAPVAQEGAQPMHKDVEWLVEAANMARRNPDLATKMRQNCKAGHAVQEVEPGSAPAAAGEARTDAVRDVLAERRRQVEAEGYDHENDDGYVNDEMAAAAAFYVMPPGVRDWAMDGSGYGATMGQAIYPDWMPPKTGDRRRELVKGAALVLAEIERLDRKTTASAATSEDFEGRP